jgi:hypothetical protein
MVRAFDVAYLETSDNSRGQYPGSNENGDDGLRIAFAQNNRGAIIQLCGRTLADIGAIAEKEVIQ